MSLLKKLGFAATLSILLASSALALDSKGGGGGSSSVPALQYTVNSLGATNSPACDFNLGYICTWAPTTASTLTVSNIPGSTTAPAFVTLGIRGISNGGAFNVTLPSTMMVGQTSGTGNYAGSGLLSNNLISGGANPWDTSLWSCDGTNCYLITASGGIYYPGPLQVSGAFVATNNLAISTDNAVKSMSRMPLTFPIAAVAATTTTQWGEQKVVKALTIENIVLSVGAFTCSVNPVVALKDCSNAAGTCTPVATIGTSGTITGIGNADITVSTAAVAAGEYLAVQFNSGTCTVFNGTIEAMARPQ